MIIKIGINFIFMFHRRPIQLVAFVPVGLSSLLHLLQVLLGVEVSSVISYYHRKLKLKHRVTFCYKMAAIPIDRRKFDTQQDLQNVIRTTKGLQERIQVIEWNDGDASK